MLWFDRLLTHYNVHLQYVSPAGLGMPEHVMEYVRSRRVSQQEYRTLDEVLPETDILYMTRIQRERFSSQEEYDKVMCTQALLNKSLCLA